MPAQHQVSGLVSTIIPVYNRPRLLREAVKCVLAQTYRLTEVIIVDDGSTDDTYSTAIALAAKHPEQVRIFRQENGGPGPARNLGLERAHGEFVQYLDSDDLLEPRKFEFQVEILHRNPNAGVCYCITQYQDANTGRMKNWGRTAERIDDIFPSFLLKRGWATLSPLWRSNICREIGPWASFRVLEDWEHDLRAGMIGVRPVPCFEPLAIVRDHEGPRASGVKVGFTPELTREFFAANRCIYLQMRDRDLLDWSYLKPFSRKMFWIARLCGSRGLVAQAEDALRMATEMTRTRHRPLEMNLFRLIVRVFGWRIAVRISEAGRTFIRSSGE